MLWSDDIKTALSVGQHGAFYGAVNGMSNGDYHSLDKYYSSTALKYLYSHSPKHFKYKYIDKLEAPKKTSEAMVIGSLVHCLLLAPHEFEKEFFVMPELNLRTNDGKEKRDEMLLLHKGKLLVTEDQLSESRKMFESARSNPQIAKLLQPNGIWEGSMFWRCPFSGLNFRAKMDYFNGPYMCEVKTANDISPEAFARQVYDLNYDLSLVHYSEGYRASFGEDFKRCYFICIENKAPYSTQVYTVGDFNFELGREKWLSATSKLTDAIATNEWHGYFSEKDEVAPVIEPPSWKINEYMKRNNREL
jgi:exodeoxyribonuclease VIII